MCSACAWLVSAPGHRDQPHLRHQALGPFGVVEMAPCPQEHHHPAAAVERVPGVFPVDQSAQQQVAFIDWPGPLPLIDRGTRDARQCKLASIPPDQTTFAFKQRLLLLLEFLLPPPYLDWVSLVSQANLVDRLHPAQGLQSYLVLSSGLCSHRLFASLIVFHSLWQSTAKSAVLKKLSTIGRSHVKPRRGSRVWLRWLRPGLVPGWLRGIWVGSPCLPDGRC